MTLGSFSVDGIGLVTSVGLNAPATCAAIRGGVTNPTQTRFMGSAGEWIVAHEVALTDAWRGMAKLAKMAAVAIRECTDGLSQAELPHIPVLLCIAEPDRPGRINGLTEELPALIQKELGCSFSDRSAVIALGRAALGTALGTARQLFSAYGVSHVLVVAADSLLSEATLAAYDRAARLLSPANPDGFIPGEGAGAVLLSTQPTASGLTFDGLGFGVENVRVDTELPLRGDGMTKAIQDALADSGCDLHQLDFRITDISGEQYYFKEAALAFARCLRQRKQRFDLWHPAGSVGETGAVAGLIALAVADAACRKRYAPGTRMLIHLSSDSGQRSASIWHYQESSDGQ